MLYSTSPLIIYCVILLCTILYCTALYYLSYSVCPHHNGTQFLVSYTIFIILCSSSSTSSLLIYYIILFHSVLCCAAPYYHCYTKPATVKGTLTSVATAFANIVLPVPIKEDKKKDNSNLGNKEYEKQRRK